MNFENLQALAALHALGALDGEDLQRLQQTLADARELQRSLAGFNMVAEELAIGIPELHQPPPGLKARLLQKISEKTQKRTEPAPGPAPFTYMEKAAEGPWHPLSVPGASVKLLSMDNSKGYAVALGKLDAGSRYPVHTHKNAEDVFILSGDLTINGRSLHAGDFHRAEAGTVHDENFSQNGCTILIVISLEDLQMQLQAGKN